MAFNFSFFITTTATTEIYTLSLHDALPICLCTRVAAVLASGTMAVAYIQFHRKLQLAGWKWVPIVNKGDRKSTRLNSSHTVISYAVFCLKKKKKASEHTDNLYNCQFDTFSE